MRGFATCFRVINHTFTNILVGFAIDFSKLDTAYANNSTRDFATNIGELDTTDANILMRGFATYRSAINYALSNTLAMGFAIDFSINNTAFDKNFDESLCQCLRRHP